MATRGRNSLGWSVELAHQRMSAKSLCEEGPCGINLKGQKQTTGCLWATGLVDVLAIYVVQEVSRHFGQIWSPRPWTASKKFHVQSVRLYIFGLILWNYASPIWNYASPGPRVAERGQVWPKQGRREKVEPRGQAGSTRKRHTKHRKGERDKVFRQYPRINRVHNKLIWHQQTVKQLRIERKWSEMTESTGCSDIKATEEHI